MKQEWPVLLRQYTGRKINHEIHEKARKGESLETNPTLANLLRVSKALGLDLGQILKRLGSKLGTPKAIGWRVGLFPIHFPSSSRGSLGVDGLRVP